MSVEREPQVQNEIVQWTCRVHPRFVRNAKGPGCCPICGLELELQARRPDEPDEARRNRMGRFLTLATVLGLLSLVALATCNVLPGIDRLLE